MPNLPQPQSLIRRIITPGALQQGRATTTSDTLYMCFDSACSMGCGASDKWGSPHNYGSSAYWQSGRLICRPCKPSHTHNIGIREPSLLNTRTHAHIHSHTHNTHTNTHCIGKQIFQTRTSALSHLLDDSTARKNSKQSIFNQNQAPILLLSVYNT